MASVSRDEVMAWLQEELSRRSYSFVEYITHASPYIPERFVPVWDLLLQLRTEERTLAEVLSRTIVQLEGLPNPQLLDESVADLNYLRLDYLAKLLVKHKETNVARLSGRIAQLSGYPLARNALLTVWETDKQHLERLSRTMADCSSVELGTQAEKERTS